MGFRRARRPRRPIRRRRGTASRARSGRRAGPARGAASRRSGHRDAPIGWPSAIAPPLTLTLSQSKPSSRPSASVCAANASLISIRSNASIGSSIRSSSRRTPSIGARNSHFGLDLGLGVADDPGERREPEPLDGALAGDDRRGRSVGDPGRVAGGDRADRGARRGPRRRAGRRPASAEPALRASSRGAVPRRRSTTVSRPLASRTVTGASSASNRPASMAAIAFWCDARAKASWSARPTSSLDRDALGVGAHVAVLDGAPQAVVDGRVDQLAVAEAIAEPGARQQVRRLVHRFHPARHRELGVAGPDLRRGQHDRLEPRAADPVDRRGRRSVRTARLAAPPGAPAPGRRRPAAPGPSGPRRSGRWPGRDRRARRPPGWRRRRAPPPGRCSARRRTCRSAFAPR